MIRCECEKEQSSQSSHSPGLVEDSEPIVYVLVEPLSFEKGSVKALKHERLKKTDMSVCRAQFLSAGEAKLLTTDTMIANDTTREDKGYVWALCSEIREIFLPLAQKGAFCVVDDASEHFHAHAHIGYSDIDDKKNERLVARGNLLKLLQRRGIFNDWAAGAPFAA
jgi:hypothetical protein